MKKEGPRSEEVTSWKSLQWFRQGVKGIAVKMEKGIKEPLWRDSLQRFRQLFVTHNLVFHDNH